MIVTRWFVSKQVLCSPRYANRSAAPNAFFGSSRCIAGTSSIAAFNALNSGSAIRNTRMFEVLLPDGAQKYGMARDVKAWTSSE